MTKKHHHHCAAYGCDIPRGSDCAEHAYVGFASLVEGETDEQAFPQQYPDSERYQCICKKG